MPEERAPRSPLPVCGGRDREGAVSSRLTPLSLTLSPRTGRGDRPVEGQEQWSRVTRHSERLPAGQIDAGAQADAQLGDGGAAFAAGDVVHGDGEGELGDEPAL